MQNRNTSDLARITVILNIIKGEKEKGKGKEDGKGQEFQAREIATDTGRRV